MRNHGAKDTVFDSKYSLNIRGKLVDLSRPVVMGILNLTPDSFYDGGRNNALKSALAHCEKMLEDGADWIDIGGESTRPQAEDIGPEEEWRRMEPVLNEITRRFPEVILSIDTYRSETARRAIENGGHIINDVSGGTMDSKMFDTVAGLRVPYILMHMRGTPANMQELAQYDDVVTEVAGFLATQCRALIDRGVHDIIIDPGFGFAKNNEHNFELLHNLQYLQNIGHPILAGFSRKSMIWKTLDIKPEAALNGTTALNMYALDHGASILRVHDVREAVETRTLWLKLNHAR